MMADCRTRRKAVDRRHDSYSVNSVRALGFDNERGKGGHCHQHGRERPCRFTTVDALVEDFIAAVAAARSKP